jgi:3-oxoacyl-[acyl-carrier-protein] synthase II
MKRVVITGIGAVTPLAASFAESWNMAKAGKSGVGPLTRILFDDTAHRTKSLSAGEISGLNALDVLSAKEINHTDLFALYAVFAAIESVENAGLLTEKKKISLPCGIVLGSSRGGISSLEKEFPKTISVLQGRQAPRRVSPFLMPETTISAACAHIGAKLGVRGYMLGVSNACASGANATGEAFRMIRDGSTAVMIAGGTEAPICRLSIEGYSSAGVLSHSQSEDASCPFDTGRDGFVLAEGACMMVLEEMEHAKRRNATIYAEVSGYGNICDASHLTQPSVKGESLAISKALEDARVSAGEVDYINAHGTSTRIGDRTEAAAIKKIFGDRPVPVNAIKSMTGHMLAASGAFEAACTAMTLKEGFVPPTINTRNIDPDCEINLITEGAELPVDLAITNSFGFGGVNTVLVLRRFSQ